jgi:hypothetical protein
VKWFSSVVPYHNIGIRCGLVSRLIAIDIDGPLGKAAFEAAAEKKFSLNLCAALGSTRMTKTSNGFHVLFRFNTDEFPEGIKAAELWRKFNPERNKDDEVLLQANGKQVVAPPSRHPDTGLYYLTNGKPIIEITKKDFMSLLAAFRKQQTAEGHEKEEQYYYTNALTPEKMETACKLLVPFYMTGRRHKFCFSLAGWFRKHFGVPQSDTEQFVTMLCNATGDEELVTDRLRAVRDAYARPADEPIAGYTMFKEVLEGTR